nr:hypothetical protein OH820_17785 [Streptomyces sp. NBC_00857]
MEEMTVGQLIEKLEKFPEDAPVGLAMQPAWPFAYSIGQVAADFGGTVWIAEGEQICYLPESAVEVLGWGRD